MFRLHPGTAPYLLLHAYSFRHIGGVITAQTIFGTSDMPPPSRREAWYALRLTGRRGEQTFSLQDVTSPYVWYRGSFVDLSRRLRLGRFAPFRSASPTQTSTPAVKKTASAQDDRLGWQSCGGIIGQKYSSCFVQNIETANF